MKEILRKYRSLISILLLVFYISAFTYNIFHFHSIDLQLNSEYAQSEKSGKNYNDSFDSKFNCVFQYKFNLLHILVLNNDCFINKNNYTPDHLLLKGDLIKLSHSFSYANPLRAPPHFS
jgi:hypothetical protein